jgi:hypothetical protein
MIKKRVVVLMSFEEHNQIKAKAGLIPLSTWFRDLALKAVQPGKEAASEVGSHQVEDGGRRHPGAALEKRSTGAPARPERRHRTRTASTVTAIEDVAHATARKNIPALANGRKPCPQCGLTFCKGHKGKK